MADNDGHLDTKKLQTHMEAEKDEDSHLKFVGLLGESITLSLRGQEAANNLNNFLKYCDIGEINEDDLK